MRIKCINQLASLNFDFSMLFPGWSEKSNGTITKLLIGEIISISREGKLIS